MGNFAVAELDEVPGRGLRDAGVIDADGRRPGQRAADPHDRAVDGQQLVDLGLGELQGHGDHGIHAFAQQEVVQHTVPALLALADVVQREVVAGIQQGGRDTFDHRGKKPPVDRRDNEADIVVAPGGQAGGLVRRDEAELSGGGAGPLPASRGNIALAAQGA